MDATGQRIINVLYYAHKPLTTLDIVKRLHLSWQTAKKYLERLYRIKMLRRKKESRFIGG